MFLKENKTYKMNEQEYKQELLEQYIKANSIERVKMLKKGLFKKGGENERI